MSIFTNVIFLSFVSFFIGSSLCLSVYVFKQIQENKEHTLAVDHYSKIKEIDANFMEKELNLMTSKDLSIRDHLKFYDFNYLQFVSKYNSSSPFQEESKFSLFVRNYISMCLTTLYFVSILMLTYYSSRFTSDVLIFFLKSEFLNYLITLVSTIASFNLTKSFLFSSKD